MFWLEDLKVRDRSGNLEVDGRIILRLILGKWFGKVWNGCVCLRTGTSDGVL